MASQWYLVDLVPKRREYPKYVFHQRLSHKLERLVMHVKGDKRGGTQNKSSQMNDGDQLPFHINFSILIRELQTHVAKHACY